MAASSRDRIDRYTVAKITPPKSATVDVRAYIVHRGTRPAIVRPRCLDGRAASESARLRHVKRYAVLWSAFAVACQGGVTEPERDAGTIVAARDAGDATARDGGEKVDAGTPDAGHRDGGPRDAGSRDAGTRDGGVEPDGGPPPPSSIFFVGNSFTFQGPVPDLVHDLAVAAQFPEPNVDFRAVGGQSLDFHRNDASPEAAPGRIDEGWDVVVLQDFSTRPTDAIGDPAGFKMDATWFHDRARTANASCRVVLYETWARHPDHAFYPGTFADPADMQAQLRTHYFDAADNYIPANATLPVDVTVAPVGDAWEMQLAGGDDPRLHGNDDYHANAAGQYLNALVIYSTIYGRSAQGQLPIGVPPNVAEVLQQTADLVTGQTRRPPVVPFAIGDTVRLDIGPVSSTAWPGLLAREDVTAPLTTDDGDPTGVVVSTYGFDGTQEGGRLDNTLGWPGEVSQDSFWVGSFDGHEAALAREGAVILRGFEDGLYTVTVFASRTGDDGGNGRLTRYGIGGVTMDLEASDNVGSVVTFTGVAPVNGGITIDVTVSPAGTGRFGYVGAVVVERTQ